MMTRLVRQPQESLPQAKPVHLQTGMKIPETFNHQPEKFDQERKKRTETS